MKLVKSVILKLSLLILFGVNIATAQEFDFKNLPVLSPKPDFNGVDATSGSYMNSWPLTFNAPGAGHLNVRSSFNGRRQTFSLNIYILDKTYTPGYEDPSERHIKIHLGGTDKLFTCWNSGDCTSVLSSNGSKLTRVTTNDYVFTDKDGTVYTFRPLAINGLLPCNDTSGEIGCNAAGYEAYAHVSTIVYPSGEKLTYETNTEVVTQGSQTLARDTIRSNLGYKMVFERVVAAGYTGYGSFGNWYPYLIGNPVPKISLYYGTQLVNTIVNSESKVGSILTLTQRDDLNRVYTLTYEGGRVLRCGAAGGYWTNPEIIDATPLLPIKEVTPGGVETTVTYHKVSGGTFNGYFAESADIDTSIPVKTVTKGGKTWTYNNAANSKTITDPYNKTRTATHEWVFDNYSYGDTACPSGIVSANITSVTDELWRQTEYIYGLNSLVLPTDRLETARLPEDNGYDYDYNDRGNLTAITQLPKPGSLESSRVIFRAGYPVSCDSSNFKFCNKPLWTENGKANRTDYTYSATHGGILTLTKPAQPNGVRPQIRFGYSSVDTGDGLLWRRTSTSECVVGSSCIGTVNELKTTTTYWGNTLLPSSEITASGNSSISITKSYTYNNAGLMTSTSDAMGQTSYVIYDVVGRKIGEISADPDGTGPLTRQATRTTYNNDDKPTRVEKGTVTGVDLAALNAISVSQYVDTSYDSVGRKVQNQVVASGQTYSLTQYSYDAWNRLLCTANRMNFSSVPQDACVLGTLTTNGYDRITMNQYNDAGELVKVYRAYGTPIEQAYAEYEYTGNGKKAIVIDANRNKAHLKYDGYDRQTHWYLPSKTKGSLTYSTTDYEQYGYDLNDNRTSFRKRDGVILSYQYDNLDRMTRKTVPERADLGATHSEDVFYDYDNRGLALSTRFGSTTGQGVFQTWDTLGRMLTSSINLDGVTRTFNYTYNLNGVRKDIKHPDNQLFVYNLDNLNRLTSVTHSAAGTLASYAFDKDGQLDIMGGGITSDYGYDGTGRVTSLAHDLASTANDNTYTYVYNPVSQLLNLTTSNTSYTPANGQQAQTYQVNGLNQYTNVGSAAYEYDANGNLTFDGSTRYTYDLENRLVKAVTSGGSLKAELWYDPMGRLYKTQTPSTTTHFLYDGDELIAEFSGTSTSVLQRYVHGIFVDDPVAWLQGAAVSSTNRQHLRANHQGSIVAVSDSAGNKLHLPRYDNWGLPQGTHPLRFGYTGQTWMAELGLWHYKARMYSPTIGRFLQTDPVGYEDQINLYAYVGNDPVNMVDPTGLSSECAGGYKYYCSAVSNDKTRMIIHEEQGPLASDGVYPFPIEDAPDACSEPCVPDGQDDFGDDTDDFFDEDNSSADDSTDNILDKSNSDEDNSREKNLTPETPEPPEKDELLSK